MTEHPNAGEPVAEPGRTATWWIGPALVAAVVLLYGQVAGHEFVNWDDDAYIFKNPYVRAGLSQEGVSWAFTSFHTANWHPVTWLSHMVDSQLFGMRPAGHHIVNVLLHAANAVLLLFALRSMTGRVWPSTFVAALFALHPLRVESVAWAAERKDVLSGLFFVLTLLAYAGYVRRSTPGRYLLVALSLAVGLMAKPMLVTLPLLLLLLDFWPLRRWTFPGSGVAARAESARPLPWLVLEKLPLLALSAGSSLVTSVAQRSGGSLTTLELWSFSTRLSTALVAYVSYLGKTVWPVNLACFYPHPAGSAIGEYTPWTPTSIAAGLSLVAVTVAAVVPIRSRPYLAVGWFWYLGTMLPVIGLFQIGGQAIADRYTYLPLIGIYIAVVWSAVAVASRWPRVRGFLVFAGSVFLVALMALTWLQVRTWRNSRTLFEHTLAVTSGNSMIENNLGNVLLREGELAKAVTHYQEAIRINPGYAKAHNNLGIVHERQGDLDGAAEMYRRAIAVKPSYPEAHRNLGSVLERQGRIDLAVSHYQRAIELNPRYADAHNNLGVVYERRGDLARARAHFERCLEIAPNRAATHFNLAIVLARQGELRRAAAEFEATLDLDPDFPNARSNLERARALLGGRQ